MNDQGARPAVEVRHNAAESRFEAALGSQLAVCDYRRSGSVLLMPHTWVPAQYEGRGIAAALVEAALAWARAQGLKVQPACSYVAGYMRRHPETQDLLATR